MYQFSSKLRITAITLMVLGFIGIVIGFVSAPSSEAEVAEMLHHADEAHHGGGHHETTHEVEHKETHHDAHAEEHVAEHKEESYHKDHANEHSHDTHKEDHHEASHGEGHDSHLAHTLHKLKNRPWAAVYVSLFFFTFLTLVVFVFLVIQRVAQAGWSIVLFRVMEGIAGNLLPISIVLLVFILISAFHGNHLFVWMAEGTLDPESSNYDPIVAGKSWWLNTPGWVIRSIIYLVGWNIFRFLNRKFSLLQDNAGDLVNYTKNYKVGVGFLIFFIFTESMSAWDWIMSIDPHWFSTLFGWYVLATFLAPALTLIAMVTVYLKSKGHLEIVNDSHLHDLAKFMFGFSVFWTYLWFAQFMLIWYADMPEETTYFVQRFDEYKTIFLAIIPLNFILPILMLVDSDLKRIPHMVLGTGTIILIGHYIDVFVMVMPGTVGDQWGFGFAEIGAFLFFAGFSLFFIFRSLSKAPLIAKGNPFLHESEHFHY